MFIPASGRFGFDVSVKAPAKEYVLGSSNEGKTLNNLINALEWLIPKSDLKYPIAREAM